MTDNAPERARLHDWAPHIIGREYWETWLTAPMADLYQSDRPLPADRMAVEATAQLWASDPNA